MIQQAMRQANLIVQALKNERLPAERVTALQNRKLRQVVRHAWANSTFYRRKFRAAGLEPDDIQSVQDLAKLPLTTKAELQAADPKDLLAHGFTPENTFVEMSTDAAGRVLYNYHAPREYDAYFALAFRHLWDMGYRPWHRVAYTSYDPLRTLPWEKLGLGARRQIDLRKSDPRSYVQDLLRIKPHIITAYPSILILVIKTATPQELARIRPRAIHLHKELLTTDVHETISRAFDCPCFDDYSSFGFHQIACECRRRRYHLAADNVIAEFVRQGKPVPPGEAGQVVLTSLINRAMPLLRYAIGDVGALDDEVCPCGRGFPTMKLLQFRADDYVLLPSGRIVSPRAITPVFENLPGVLEYVLVQETPDRIVTYLRVAPEYVATIPSLVEQALQNLFQEPIRLEVELADEFERHRQGKPRSIVSNVASYRQVNQCT
jgi:phenylacetate-CoA ligase